MPLDHKYIYVYTYQDQCHWVICILARTYVFGSSTYQDLSVNQILTRTPVHRLYIYLPGPMSLDHMYVCQDLCPWIIHLLTRTYVLGSYVYLPGPMSLDYTSTYQDLGLYIYLPGPMSLEFTYSIQDLCSWIICILTRTDIYEKKIDKLKTDECTEKEAYGETTVCRQVEMEVCRWWRQKDMTCR